MMAAIASAVAALFAAAATFLLYRIERQRQLEDARPEIVIGGWLRQREGESAMNFESIRFTRINNVGRGPALHLHIVFNVIGSEDSSTKATIGGIREHILAPGETAECDERIGVFWNKVEPDGEGRRMVRIVVQVGCWDSLGFLHETRYDVDVFERGAFPLAETSGVQPGVSIRSRVSKKTGTLAAWRRRHAPTASIAPIAPEIANKPNEAVPRMPCETPSRTAIGTRRLGLP